MSKRLYLPSTGAAAISPAFSSGWEDTSVADRKAAVATRIGSSFGSQAKTVAIGSAPYDILLRQYVYGPIAAQTITGTVLGQILALENFASNIDAEPQIRIFVVNAAGTTIRGTLLDFDSNATADSHEFSNTGVNGVNRQFPRGGSASVTSVTSQNGDYLVIEVGARKTSASSSSRSATLRFGDNSGTDLAQDETTTTDNNPWIEFGFTIADATSGQTITMGQPSETDTSQPMTRHKTRAITQPSESDTTASFTHGHVVAMGQATSTSSAFPIKVAPRRRLMLQSVESALAQVMTPHLSSADGGSDMNGLPLLDDFNRPDHADLGVNWHTDTGSQDTYEVESDTATAINAPFSVTTCAWWIPSEGMTDQAWSVLIVGALPLYDAYPAQYLAFPHRGVTGRVLVSAVVGDEGYIACVERDPDNLCYLYIYLGGSFGLPYDVLAGPILVDEPVPGTTRIGISCIGEDISCWYAPDGTFGSSPDLTVSDSTYTTGPGGISAYGHDDDDELYDDFAGGVLTSGGSPTLGQPSESDSANAMTRRKTKAITQPSETDTANAMTRVHRRTLSQPTETDSTTAMGGPKTKAITQATETDTGQHPSAVRTRGTSQATETDTSTALGHTRAHAMGQPNEADTGNTVKPRRTHVTSQPSETDTALSPTHTRSRLTGQPTESDISQPITRHRTHSIGQPSETDTGSATAHSKTVRTSQPSEGDVANAIISPGRKLNQPSEADTATHVTCVRIKVLSQATEADSAALLAHTRLRPIGQPSETDTATAIARIRTRTLGQPSESDSATSFSSSERKAILQASDTSVAFAITARTFRHVQTSQATESDSTNIVSTRRTHLFTQAVETDLARHTGANPLATIHTASEADIAFTVTYAKHRHVTGPPIPAGTIERPKSGTIDRSVTATIDRSTQWL